jgi:hypothetical protein
METKEKTPWRKNLDKRYISGEDLLTEMKGLKKEMVVTLAKYEDSPAFDQKKQEEVDKTAIWLKEYPSGALIYKPALLNVSNGEFLSKEIGNNSLFLEDFATDKPFVMYAKPDKRHGHVVRFKKYFPPASAKPEAAIKAILAAADLAALTEAWSVLTIEEKNLPAVIAAKDKRKGELS